MRPARARHRGPHRFRTPARPDLPRRVQTVAFITVCGAVVLGFCLDALDPTSDGSPEGGLDVIQAAMVSLVALAAAVVPSALASWLLDRWWAAPVMVVVVVAPLWWLSIP